MRVKLLSPAKINHSLRVIAFNQLEKKHKLSSRVNLLKLSDIITISNSKKLSINYFYQKKKLIIKNDIILKAIKYFDHKYNKKSNFIISIQKKIPIGYGLGGGSSNAATILKFLYKFYDLPSLHFYKDAPFLGSDVLLFSDQSPKIIDGLKNARSTLGSNNKPPRWRKIFLIFPQKKNITKVIFQKYFDDKNKYLKLKKNKNDLIYAAFEKNKELERIYNFLNNFNANFKSFGMSGSGSCLFVSFKSISAEKTINRHFSNKFPLVRIEKTYYFG